MKKDDKILLGLLIIVIIGLLFTVFQLFTERNTEENQSLNTIATGSTDSGDVLIELTPKIVNDKLEVTIAANTHSVDLSQFDLMEITTLQTKVGKIKPASAPKLSGHHSTGTIIFDVKEKEFKKEFAITIRSIPSIEEREYKWT